MKLSERIKTYNFWVSLSSAIFLIIKVLGTQIGFDVDESLFSDLITSICSILVLLGIIVPPKNPELKTCSKVQNTNNNEPLNNEVVTSINEQSQLINNSSDIQESSDSSTNQSEIIEEPIIDKIETPERYQIEDVELESADVNLENIDNIHITEINSLDLLKSNFETELNSQEKLFENNLDEYVKLLEIELEKIKSK